jgi:hypothetical protein
MFNVSAQLRQFSPDLESDIESLARETDMPIATVQEIYKIERAKLDQAAKIKAYVPVLIRRRVKELLRVQNSTLKIDVFNRPSARVKPII